MNHLVVVEPAAPNSLAEPDLIRAGRVVSTTGTQVVILLDADANRRSAVQMGSLVCVRSPLATLYGTIEGLCTPAPSQFDDGAEAKLAEIGLIGEVPNPGADRRARFRRGISKLPSLDAIVYLADRAATAMVYALNKPGAISIGSVYQDPTVPARVSVDDMLCKHFAVLGTTGTGKSCGLTMLLKRILEKSPNGHVLLLDPHGEYGAAFEGQAELLDIENFRLPYWLCNFEEFVDMVFGAEKTDAATEIMLLRDLVLAAKLKAQKSKKVNGTITIDTPVPYSMNDLGLMLEEAIGRLENRSNLPPYLRIKARLNSLQSDRRYNFMFDTGLMVRDEFAAVLGRLLRVPANGKPLAILALAGIPSEVLNVVVAVLCRLAFEFAVLMNQRWPMLIVCEEAHRYAPQDSSLGFESAKRALSRIAKEGRKYGISLGLVSQRPSDLATSILSQCSTVFSFRLANERDQEIIKATLSDANNAMFSVLPFLGTSEAIVIGEAVSMPTRMRFDILPANERPRSQSAPYHKTWQAEELDDPKVALGAIVAGLRGFRNE
jgi:DNA helicase HerA-like ATPase